MTLDDYKNPFDAVLDFEKAVSNYTGAPYCVTTDCCSHAIEIAFRLTFYSDMIVFPARTYLSVPMTLHKLNIPFMMTDEEWTGEYHFKGSKIWDCARRFDRHMYREGTLQCVSFGRTKPLQIGRGGCILTDSKELYESASRMRMDGRNIFKYSPWINQPTFEVGYHYYMRPEECLQGLNMLANNNFTRQLPEYYQYPDCRQANIKPYAKILL
jgi:dTDP-4-amino-4,6-dideoxygalactose transaminase